MALRPDDWLVGAAPSHQVWYWRLCRWEFSLATWWDVLFAGAKEGYMDDPHWQEQFNEYLDNWNEWMAASQAFMRLHGAKPMTVFSPEDVRRIFGGP